MKNKKLIIWMIIGAISLILIITNCAGVTPVILGGLPALAGCLGLSFSLTNIFIS